MNVSKKLVIELEKVGLSGKAAGVYAAVLELGVAFPSKIAEVTALNRSTVYHVLTDLAVKGLVTEIERNGKLCYQIEKPDRLVRFSRSQISLAEDRLDRAKSLLPEIEGLFSLTQNKPRVRFFEGIDGILSLYDDHVAGAEPYEMLSYSNVEELLRLLPARFVQSYLASKKRLNVTTRAILPMTPFSKAYNARVYRDMPKRIHVRSHFIPAEQFPFKAEVTVYGGNKVSVINFHENVLIGVIIEDATIAGVMRMGFELAWNGLDAATKK